MTDSDRLILQLLSTICFIASMVLFVAGAFVLFGIGWSLLAGSIALFLLSYVISRGLTHVQ